MCICVSPFRKKSLFRALCRVKMLRCGEVPLGSIEDYPLFAERGYIEGFYGSPWSFLRQEKARSK